MNNSVQHASIEQAAQAIRLARQHLDASVNDLPHDITEQLRAARFQALSQKPRPSIGVEKYWSDALMGWLKKMPTFSKAAFGLPALCFAVVVAQNTVNNYWSHDTVVSTAFDNTSSFSSSSNKTNQTLNIDAILSEKIPLHAYLDKEFNQLLEKSTFQISSELNNVSKTPQQVSR